MKKCRIGIIGFGRIGKLHAENIHYRLPQFELMGIAEPYADVEWAKSIHVPFITSFANDLIERKDIDALIIASPSDMHTQQITAASKADKAIFCEKPLGLSEEEIQNALAVVEKNNTLLQIGFNRRFDPDFANIHARVRAGELGSTHLLRITSRDPACPSKEYIKTSGGLFMDMAIHDFDMARFLMDSEVTEVYAAGSALINPEFAEFNDIDTAITQLRFQNGALGVIDNSRQAVYGYDQRIEVFGEKGALFADNRIQHGVRYLGQGTTSQANPLYFFLERYQDAYLAELKSFYESWCQQKPTSVSGFDGLQALRIALAAKQSLQTRQPVAIA